MTYFIIAGEASGDLHASSLVREIYSRDPAARIWAMGGDLCANAGAELVRHYRDMAFMGVINVVRNWGKIRDNYREAQRVLTDYKPDVLVLVDYPSFNLKLAKFCKVSGLPTRVVYYISPKLWAWKSYRIRSIRRYVDRMLLILPFEEEYYSSRGYDSAVYVGNPLVDAVGRWRRSGVSHDFRPRHGLDSRPIVALLPGSRTQEIKGCLPRMLSACRRFMVENQVVIAGAPGQPRELYADIAGQCPVVFDDTYSLLDNASAAVVNSGTATLEAALIGCPQAVVYNIALPHLASVVKPYIIKTRHVSLVNIIAGREVVRELIAADFTELNVTAELSRLLNDADYRQRIIDGYGYVSDLLGDEGVAARAAYEIMKLL